MVRWLVVVVGTSSLFAAPAVGGEGEWSRFRGPNGSGVSDAATVPARWTEDDYNWKIDLPGAGHSSPVVWGKRVFVTCGDPLSARRFVLCLDAASGRTLWQRDFPSTPYPHHADGNYATATPAVDADGLVLTWTTPEQVLVVALALDGHELWRRDLGPFVAVHGSGSSPILFDRLAVLANDQEDPGLIPGHKTNPPEPAGKSFFIALDRHSGQTCWQIDRRTIYSAYSTPCVYQAEGGPAELIFSNTAHGITAVDPASGKVAWEFGQPFMDRAVSSPIVAGGLVIAGHGAGIVASRYVAVRPPSAQPGPTLAYSLTRSIPLVPTPLAKDGRLFLWTDDGVVSCLRLEDGQLVWRKRVGGAYYGSPVWVGGRLYCMSRDGQVVVVSASDKFEIVARVPLGDPSYATPAVAGGVMYLRTRSRLFSLGGSGKASPGNR
jgi:outer membrane protein assembly factor BamB